MRNLSLEDEVNEADISVGSPSLSEVNRDAANANERVKPVSLAPLINDPNVVVSPTTSVLTPTNGSVNGDEIVGNTKSVGSTNEPLGTISSSENSKPNVGNDSSNVGNNSVGESRAGMDIGGVNYPDLNEFPTLNDTNANVGNDGNEVHNSGVTNLSQAATGYEALLSGHSEYVKPVSHSPFDDAYLPQGDAVHVAQRAGKLRLSPMNDTNTQVPSPNISSSFDDAQKSIGTDPSSMTHNYPSFKPHMPTKESYPTFSFGESIPQLTLNPNR